MAPCNIKKGGYCTNLDIVITMFTFGLIGNDEAARAYTMIEPIKRTLGEIDELMRYRNYQPAIDRITEVIEVRIRCFLERMLPLEEFYRVGL